MADDTQKYLIRDTQGNVYGPADAGTLRQWVQQGRVVPGMFIAPRETRQWVEASSHPVLADLLYTRTQTSGQSNSTVTPALPAAQAQPARSLPAPMSYSPAYPQPTNLPGEAQLSYAQPPRQNVMGILSFLLGMGGMVFSLCGCFPICGWFVITPLCGLLDIAAITLGSIALYQIHENPAVYSSRGFAISGLSIGIAMLLIYLVVALLFFSGFSFHP